MPLRVSQIRLPLAGDEKSVLDRALKRAGIDRDDVDSIEVVRKSMDRRRRDPEFVYTIDIHFQGGRPVAQKGRGRRRSDVQWVDPVDIPPVEPGGEALPHRPVILGQGPAGLFAALVLARGGYAPLVVDRGSKMNRRVRQIEELHREHVLDPESNYLFGEGGAGTFSDGKLTSRSKDPRARAVLDEFRRNSGMDTVGYYYRPHLGSDRVRAVVAKLRREIERLGGEFRYDCRVNGLDIREGVLRGVSTSLGDIPAEVLICAPGHSARDFYQRLFEDGVSFEPKPFQMGFRVEHSQDYVDTCIYRSAATHPGLPPADYRLAAQIDGDGVFSFCMCPGGEIIPAVHDAGHYNTNGMSCFNRGTGFANSGVVTTIFPEQFEEPGPFGGIRLQERYEALAAEVSGPCYLLPAQRLSDFVAERPSSDIPATSCRTGVIPTNIGAFVPSKVEERIREALRRFDQQMPGYISDEAVICGPEARSSAPVRILRENETLEALGVRGLFPVGEGAGYAGGIVSAAVDGWKAAEFVIARHQRPLKTV